MVSQKQNWISISIPPSPSSRPWVSVPEAITSNRKPSHDSISLPWTLRLVSFRRAKKTQKSDQSPNYPLKRWWRMVPWTVGWLLGQRMIAGTSQYWHRPYLPKELVHRIFSYLHLRDCATTALVCHYWKVCYHNIYFNYSFLREFDSDRYSAGEMATVFKKAGSKMKHIRKIKEILKG